MPGPLLVLGATGGTGRQVVRRALAKGYPVTALARHPERLGMQHPALANVARDLTRDPESLAALLPGHAAVICALGRGTSLRAEGLMASVTPALLSAQTRTGVRRLVFLSAYGVGGTAPEAPWILRLMFRFMLNEVYADKALAERAVRESELDWTILAPVILSNGPATGRFRLGEAITVRGPARISRDDVADALLRCLEDPGTVGRRLVVAP